MNIGMEDRVQKGGGKIKPNLNEEQGVPERQLDR